MMAKELQTFLEYPPMQRGASFNLDAVKAEMAQADGTGGRREQGAGPIADGGNTLICVSIDGVDARGSKSLGSTLDVFAGVMMIT